MRNYTYEKGREYYLRTRDEKLVKAKIYRNKKRNGELVKKGKVDISRDQRIKEFYNVYGIYPNEQQLKEFLRWKEVQKSDLHSPII